MKIRPLFFILPVFTALFAAKPPPSPDEGLLEKSVKAMGGFSKFQRLESLSYEFEEVLSDRNPPLRITGRYYLKMHDDKGVRVREETESALGKTVAVLNSAGVYRWKDGRLDPDADPRAVRSDLAQKSFVLMAPPLIQEAGGSARYLGSGFLSGHLFRRLSVQPVSAPLVPADASFTLYLDTATHLIQGIVMSQGEASTTTLSLGSYAPFQNLLVLPMEAAVLGDKGAVVKTRFLRRLALNSYLDESLFASPVDGY
jgi:hypothetical protein